MTKIVGYTALLYGSDFLGYAIRSIIDYIDEYHVIYSPMGAHGSYTAVPCPDSRADLYDIATRAAGDKLRWHDAGPFRHEGEQRDSIHEYAPDADVILVLDADEIWPRKLAHDVIDFHNRFYPSDAVHRLRLPMIHFWRSFHKAVLHDPAYPERVIYPKYAGKGTATFSSHDMPIAHMGYAQRSEIVRFKLLTHGHRGEFRRDVDWFNDVFMANRQTDCHPVGSEYWNPETVDPLKYMPSFMSEHPYFKMDVIP